MKTPLKKIKKEWLVWLTYFHIPWMIRVYTVEHQGQKDKIYF